MARSLAALPGGADGKALRKSSQDFPGMSKMTRGRREILQVLGLLVSLEGQGI